MRDTPAEVPDDAPLRPPAVFSQDAGQLLRTTQQVQYQLSQMADQKASMLLGITFVIFTIAVGQARVSAPQPALLILGGAAFLAAVLTVLAVMPTTKPPADTGAQNLLFFGVFSHMSQEEYVAALLAGLNDTQSTYEVFARDIYQNGKVLAGKKYRLLGYAYRVLLAGLVASLVAFLAPYAMKLAGA